MKEEISQDNYEMTIPSSFHNYHVIEPIGKGSSSEIFKVEKIQTKEVFCAKIISKKYIESKNLTDQIKNEISIMKQLNHPNIVKFYESFEIQSKEDSYIVIIMEYCENVDLCNYIAKIKDDNTRKKIIEGFLKSIQYIHKLRIAHLDIKPNNILIDSSLNAKLSDFGLSQRDPIGDDDTKFGTLIYAPPELLKKGDFLTQKADIWEIGITLYCISENSFPYDIGNKNFIIKQILLHKLKFKSSLPPDLKRIIEKCTDKDPENRPTIDEIINDECFSCNERKDSTISETNISCKFNLLKLSQRKKHSNPNRSSCIFNEVCFT